MGESLYARRRESSVDWYHSRSYRWTAGPTVRHQCWKWVRCTWNSGKNGRQSWKVGTQTSNFSSPQLAGVKYPFNKRKTLERTFGTHVFVNTMSGCQILSTGKRRTVMSPKSEGSQRKRVSFQFCEQHRTETSVPSTWCFWKSLPALPGLDSHWSS